MIIFTGLQTMCVNKVISRFSHIELRSCKPQFPPNEELRAWVGSHIALLIGMHKDAAWYHPWIINAYIS